MSKPCRGSLPACLLLLAMLVLGACRPSAGPAEADPAAKPARAVRLLTGHLRDNDLDAFARDAVPPALHARLETAWREGRTRWPLDELPFGRRLPEILKALAAPDAPGRLQKVYDRQFAHADREIRGAARTLGVFGAQYLQQQGDYSDDERQHYGQLIEAVSLWGAQAPLGDPKRARLAIARLHAAAARTGLVSAAAFAEAGMDESLRRIGPFAAACKRSLVAYGWDLDADLAGVDASLQQQTGDSARVRMRYTLAGQPVDTVVTMQRIDGRWYVADFLRHARAALQSAPPPGMPAKSSP